MLIPFLYNYNLILCYLQGTAGALPSTVNVVMASKMPPKVVVVGSCMTDFTR